MKFKTSKKLFIHVDCDSFFASCEIMRNPNLKNKFVCVWGDIIVAACYKSKSLGIGVGTPIWEAKKILKQNAVFLSPDIEFYSKISSQLMNFLEKNSIKIDPFSIDEAFCEISGIPEYYEVSTQKYLQKIQKDILDEIGVPVSIWCANTRIKAKIFSKINKPFWIFAPTNREEEKNIFQNLSLKNIPFIWKSSQKKLEYKAQTIADFLHLWFWEIKKIFWKNGTTLRFELMWIDAYIVKKSLITKSISRTRSFNKSITNDKNILKEKILMNFERAFEVLYEKNMEIGEVGIMFRDKNFYREYAFYKIPTYSNNHKEILEKIIILFEKLYSHQRLCRSTGVFFYKLRNYLPKQASLFDPILRNKDQNYELVKKINSLNKQLWTHKITFGTSLLGKGKQVVQHLRE